MKISTANKRRKKAQFIQVCKDRSVWLNTGFYLYNNWHVSIPRNSGDRRLSAFIW